jgi:3-oxoadipate enol-lactonase
MSFVELSAGRTHYELIGPAAAPVVVLSNSLGATLAMWEPQVAPLSRRFRVLRYDARGHGLSAAPAGPYALEHLGRDVLEMLDALKIERANFCGLSMGGLTGLWLGIHAGGRIERLVACNTAARVGTAEAWNSRMAAVRSGGMQAVTPALLERWFTAAFRERSPAVIESTREMLLGAPVEGYLACCAAVRDADLREKVSAIKIPTLVISGASDPVTPPAEGRSLAEKISGARHVELDAAHLSNIEAAAQFTDALLQFLSEI